MSDNVAIVRSIYAAWSRGDFGSVEWADPEIEFVAADGPDPGVSKGVAAMGARWGAWKAIWDSYRSEALDVRELDGGRVLVHMQHGGRGKASGVEVDQLDRRGINVFE